MDPDRGQVLNGAGWSVLAWNPAWIRECEGAWLHANFLMHKSNSPEGLRLIDQQRHGGDWGTLRDHITLGDSEQTSSPTAGIFQRIGMILQMFLSKTKRRPYPTRRRLQI